MSKKIATINAVFDTCDTLESSGKPWNRDDVRATLGGGGFNIIDPLIKAWRALKPLREIAPATPTPLLHQISLSINEHIEEFTEQVEQRDKSRNNTFEEMFSELSETISGLERALAAKESDISLLNNEIKNVHEKAKQADAQIKQKEEKIIKLEIREDELLGDIKRLASDNKEAEVKNKLNIDDLVDRHERNICRLKEEHKSSLEENHNKHMHILEQTENRLMKLIDQERQESKSKNEEHKKDLATLKSELLTQIDKASELSTENKHLNQKLSYISIENRELKTEISDITEKFELLQIDFSKLSQEQTSSQLSELTSTILSLKKELEIKNES